MKVRKSAKMSRIRKGDTFVDPNTGDLVTAQSYSLWHDRKAGVVTIPLQVDGKTRSSRRRFDADLRVALI